MCAIIYNDEGSIYKMKQRISYFPKQTKSKTFININILRQKFYIK